MGRNPHYSRERKDPRALDLRLVKRNFEGYVAERFLILLESNFSPKGDSCRKVWEDSEAMILVTLPIAEPDWFKWEWRERRS